MRDFTLVIVQTSKTFSRTIQGDIWRPLLVKAWEQWKETRTDGSSWEVHVRSHWTCRVPWNQQSKTNRQCCEGSLVRGDSCCQWTQERSLCEGVCDVYVCVGAAQRTAAGVISCLPRPLLPAFCWQGTHSRDINEINRLPLPAARSAAPQCFDSWSRPGWTELDFKHIWIPSHAREVEAVRLSESDPGRNEKLIRFLVCCRSEFVPLSYQAPEHPHLHQEAFRDRKLFSVLNSFCVLLNYSLEPWTFDLCLQCCFIRVSFSAIHGYYTEKYQLFCEGRSKRVFFQ